MTGRGERKLLGAIASLVIVFISFGMIFGFKNSWDLINLGSGTLIPFIIAGIIMLVLGLNEKYWGSLVFGIVALICAIISFI